MYVHSLGYKSYATLFYARVRPATDSAYRGMRVDNKGRDLQPEANEQWLLNGKIDKPVYFICKVQDAGKFRKLTQLQETGAKNGLVFFLRDK